MLFRVRRGYELLYPLIDLELKNPSSVCPVSKECFRYTMRGVEDVPCGSPPYNP